MLKFYMAPGSCSTGIHILLEELEAVFEVYIVNLPAGDHLKPEFLALNPKSSIPVLVRADGSVLSEFQAIAWWLARTHPRARLLPDDAEGEARVVEALSYIVGTLHGQGFARIFASDKFMVEGADVAAVQARGHEIVSVGYALLDAQLGGRDWLVGERFSIADAALFYVEFWGAHLKLALPPHCEAHYRRMRSRPAVARVLAEEGYR